MNYVFLVATVSLALQFTILGLILLAYWLKVEKRFRTHGFVMLAALVTHAAIILVIMVPSFAIGLVPTVLKSPENITSILSLIHAVTGSAATVLGFWIVASWRLRPSLEYCAPKKKMMLITFVAWLVSLVLGVALFFVLNWTFLFG